MKHNRPLVHNQVPITFLTAWSAQSCPKNYHFGVYFKLILYHVHLWNIVHYFFFDTIRTSSIPATKWWLYIQAFKMLPGQANVSHKLGWRYLFICASFASLLPLMINVNLSRCSRSYLEMWICFPCLSSELYFCQNEMQNSQSNCVYCFGPLYSEST